MMKNNQNKTKKVTLNDIALEAGVGPATVDRFLNGRSSVKAKTAEKIIAAIEKLQYRPSKIEKIIASASPTAKNQSPRIGFIFPEVKNSVYELLLEQLNDVLSQEYISVTEPLVCECNIQDYPAIAKEIDELCTKVDYICIVALDDPTVGLAIEKASRSGVRIFTLFSPLSDYGQIAHIGLDDRKAGRSAAWMAQRLVPEIKEIAIFQGNNRFLCQETCEISFRSYLREKNIEIKIIGPLYTQEDNGHAEKQADILIKNTPDINLIYAPCGGVNGIIASVSKNKCKEDLFVICHGPFPKWKQALIDETVDIIIQHDMNELTQAFCKVLAGHYQESLTPHFFPVKFEVKFRENIQ